MMSVAEARGLCLLIVIGLRVSSGCDSFADSLEEYISESVYQRLLKRGRVLFPGYWAVGKECHFVVYSIDLAKQMFSIYNSGLGARHHTLLCDGRRSGKWVLCNIQPIDAYSAISRLCHISVQEGLL
jgi:hypothetical protein